MDAVLPFVVSGTVIGTIYGLAATGLVLTYKTSGIFNFGHGAIATAAAYVFHALNVDVGLGWQLSMLASVLVSGVVVGVLMERFANKLRPQSTALKIVGTIGIVLLVQGIAALKYGTDTTFVSPFLPGSEKTVRVLATAILLLSLGLLVKTSGQVSLCHSAFAAIGAVAFSQLNLDAGFPWVLAVLAAGLIAVPVGALVAIPAIRLSGLFLALATFAFGIFVQQFLYPQSWMFTQLAQGREMPHPSFAQSPKSFYFVVLVAFVLTSAVMVAIQRSRLGRILRGLAGSPTGVSAMGLNVDVARVTVFCISAFFAAVSGALVGVERNFASGGDPFYGSFYSLILLAMLALAPFAEPWYALVLAGAVVLPAYLGGDNVANWLNVVFGLSAIGVAMAGGNPTLPSVVRSRIDRLGAVRGRNRLSTTTPVVARKLRTPAGGIELRGLSVRYGGLVAVESLNLAAPMGKITGLIGPNGAGKTSAFDACSGFNRRAGGRVLLHGADVTGASPSSRARMGLGRTFQLTQLCDGLTVEENVRLGQEAGVAGANPVGQMVASRAGWATTRAYAEDAMNQCGIDELRDAKVSDLSTGQRRLVELARCLAGSFDFLLLDEPSSGLDPDETARFGDLLVDVVAERGVGILLIEHDMSLVMRVCSHIHVLDFGASIFDGTPAEIGTSASVRSAYLGSGELSVREGDGALA